MNSHKNTPSTDDIPKIIKKLREEITEFEQQYKEDMFDENALMELMDQANFAFLAFVALRNRGAKTTKERIIEEFLTIDAKRGKVLCKKGRVGGQYKPGEEIKGSTRNGYVDIKLQKIRSGITSISIPRSHLVWYQATGKWPTNILDHKNGKRDDDRIVNLRDVTFAVNNLNKIVKRKYPSHVTKYAPSGREHLPNYGKYVFQKVYKGVNIRIAYFDSPEEAAKKGEYQWKKKIKKMESK